MAAAVTKPWQALKVELLGIKTDGDMAADVSLANQRPAEYSFSRHVQQAMDRLKHEKPAARSLVDAED